MQLFNYIFEHLEKPKQFTNNGVCMTKVTRDNLVKKDFILQMHYQNWSNNSYNQLCYGKELQTEQEWNLLQRNLSWQKYCGS